MYLSLRRIVVTAAWKMGQRQEAAQLGQVRDNKGLSSGSAGDGGEDAWGAGQALSYCEDAGMEAKLDLSMP